MSDPASIKACAETVKTKLGDEKLYALVNNAGVFKREPEKELMIQTNVYGTKNMTEAFTSLIADGGRIVNLGSGVGAGYVSKLDKEKQNFLSSKQVTWEELEAYLKAEAPTTDDGIPSYGLTKAIIHKYSEITAKANSKLIVSAVTPGFVETNLTAKVGGNKLTPEQGCKSTLHTLFADLGGSGFYFGSDALRSPLHVTRNAGEPEFTGY